MTKSKEINVKIIFCFMLLCIFVLVMQYSASSYNALKETGDSFFYVKKQRIAFAVGIIALVLVTKVNTEFYKKIKWYLLNFVACNNFHTSAWRGKIWCKKMVEFGILYNSAIRVFQIWLNVFFGRIHTRP